MTINQDSAITGEVMEILAMMRPHTTSQFAKIRLGRSNDGGYVMIDDFDGIDAAYSIGINDDISWDRDIASRGVVVFQYDHTIDGVPEVLPGTVWRQIGLGQKTDPNANMQSLADMLSQNGHSESRNLILKCDIEGAELHVIPTLSAKIVQQFRQIVIEVHCIEAMHLEDTRDQIKETFSKLSGFHSVVHVHANNSAPFNIIGGVGVPSVLEFTLLRRDLAQLTPSDETFPTPLDQPCNKDRADYYLGNFAFG